jgi:2-octaprenyl-6-methoxyphenol hydroxylase
MPQSAASSDVLIAGGGPVGLTLALALARKGFAVTLADASAPGQPDDPRAWLVAAGCWRIFRALGLEAGLAPHAEPVMEVSAAGPAGGIAFLADDRPNESGALGYMIEAVRLMEILSAAVRAEPAIHRGGALSPGFTVGPDAVHAVVGDEEVRASLLVGCDGVRSTVRMAAGLRFEGRDYAAKALSAFMTSPAPGARSARQIFLSGGPLAALPMTGGRINLVWSASADVADALLAMTDAEFEAELQRQAPDFLPGARLLGPRAAFPAGVHVAERFHAPRVALAGDSAHQVHPLAGQGFNLGLKDVAALVDVVFDALRVGLDIGAEAALAPYTRWRRADVVATAAAMDAFFLAFTAPFPVRAAASLAMRAAGSSQQARGLFAGLAGGDAGDLPMLMRPV